MTERTDSRHVDGWPVYEKGRHFPPNKNRESLERVVALYHNLQRPESETEAPWVKAYTLPELPKVYLRVSEKISEFQKAIEPFIGTSLEEKMDSANLVLNHALETVYGQNLKSDEYTGALHDAMVLIFYRTYRDEATFEHYRWNTNDLPENMKRLLFNTENYILWETVAGRSGLDIFPNPFKQYVEIFNEGTYDIHLGGQNEPSFATIRTSRGGAVRNLQVQI